MFVAGLKNKPFDSFFENLNVEVNKKADSLCIKLVTGVGF
jgi:hypothetical protein